MSFVVSYLLVVNTVAGFYFHGVGQVISKSTERLQLIVEAKAECVSPLQRYLLLLSDKIKVKAHLNLSPSTLTPFSVCL